MVLGLSKCDAVVAPNGFPACSHLHSFPTNHGSLLMCLGWYFQDHIDTANHQIDFGCKLHIFSEVLLA